MAPSHETDDPVEDLVSRAVQELEQRGEPGLQEFLTRHASHAADVRAGLERLRRLGILAPPPATATERAQYGEFQVLRRIGTGGMGVVYAAKQISLQRTVALKVVRPEFLLSKMARERFQREVEAIARLQHPGIVPILAVGKEDAQPWFAMEFVDGHTLEEMIATVRGKDPARVDGNALRTGFGDAGSSSGASAVFAGNYWEACTRLVQQVAATMAYVHEQGIVHRDLKPSNIVVTKQGQALVLDFGLAHVRDLHRLTQEQKPIGTPAYVSPEQVRGEAVDERVDVYGLGVTLYELLTTHLPFPQESREALEKAILAGNPRGVRTWNGAVPRDLEIVCAVALDRDRGRRYRSMADFATDLAAVLERRPILARPLGVGLRFVRFVQRHPTWTIAACALLLVALQFPLVLWRQQADANTKLAQANAELGKANTGLALANKSLDRERATAVDAYNDALDAVQKVLVGAAQNEVITAPGGEEVQLAILRRADEMYERLRKKRPRNRRVEFDSARNLQHIGTQLGKLGDARGAETSLRAALERTAPWNGADFQYLRGSIWRILGLALDRRGDRAEAAIAYEQAYCELESAVIYFPGDRVVRRQFAEAIASLASSRGRTDRAAVLPLLLQAQEHKDALYAEWPEDLPGALTCALGCNHLADRLAISDPEAAERHANRGIDVLSPFLPVGQEEATLRAQLAALYDSRGTLREAGRRYEEAEHDHGCALALRWGLAQDFPSIAQNWFELACSFNNLAMVSRNLDSDEAALDLYSEGVARFQQAERMAPARVEYGRGLTTGLTNRAQLLLEMRQLEDLGPAIVDLAAAAKEPAAHLTAARMAIKLAARLFERDGEANDDMVALWRERAVEYVEIALARGWQDRAHFETSRTAREYDDIRGQARFQDALAKLPAPKQ